MLFDFLFGGKADKDKHLEAEESQGAAIVPAQQGELELSVEGELGIEPYEHVSFDYVTAGNESVAPFFIDNLIPMAAAAADAAEQYGQAIVKFPKGAGWGDLINRKTPGWEDWKQLGILKDGKFQPMAAIKQAKLQPAAVANLALNAAAVAVGQAYMAEISKQLDSIQSERSAIRLEMSLEREAKIESSFEMLREYITFYDEISENPDRRQAVHGAIEGIKLEALAAWNFELSKMRLLSESLSKAGRLKSEEIADNINQFRSREKHACAAFQVLAAAEQASMQYDGDFSEKRIGHAREGLSKRLEEYSLARDSVQANLSLRIERMKGNLLEVPAVEEDDYESQNLFLDAVHAAQVNAPRFWLPAMRQEAVDRLESRKARFAGETEVDSELAQLAEARMSVLDEEEFMFNKANAIEIGQEGIRLLRLPEEEPCDEAGGQSSDE